MRKKILIILFFAASAGARHAVPPQGLLLSPDTAFAATQENGQPCPPECVIDSMEIVTWYPSPYNEYEELRLYPVQRDANYCTDDKRGLMYYNETDNKVYVCKGTLDGWQELGGAGYWELSGNAIYNNNSGNVGIGKANPQAKLDVEGKIRMGSQTVDADSQDTVVTKGYLASYVTAALANSSNSLRVSGSNPSCPSGYITINKYWPAYTCWEGPPHNRGCTTSEGWLASTSPAPTCSFSCPNCDGFGGQTATCTASAWTQISCMK